MPEMGAAGEMTDNSLKRFVRIDYIGSEYQQSQPLSWNSLSHRGG